MKAAPACGIAMLLALSLYVGAIGAGFAWDDELLFHSWLPYLDSPMAVLSPPDEIPNFTFQYFRPVVLASYVADEWLASSTFPPAAREQGRRIFFHLTPVLLHVLCTALVFLLGARLARRAAESREKVVATAFVGAMLFATHPIHVESVAWIAGRSDPFATFFGLSALLALIEWRERARPWALILAAGTLLLGMLGKESAAGIVLPAVIVALAWTRDKSAAVVRGPGRTLEVICLATTVGIYAALRVAFGADASSLTQLSIGVDAITRVFASAGWYLVKLIWPFPQTVFPPQETATAYAGVGLIALALTAAGVYYFRRARFGAERTALALAVGGLLAPLAVVATTLATSPVAERHVYLSSAGFCILAALLMARLFHAAKLSALPRIPVIVLVAALIAVPWSLATSRRVRVWDDPLLFWQSAVASAPRSPVARINLGQALMLAGRFDESERAYLEATELPAAADQLAMARANLGSLYLRRDRTDLAIDQFAQALEVNPRDASAMFNWASASARKARIVEDATQRDLLFNAALDRLGEALSLHPRYGKARLLLGTILLEQGRSDEARTHLATVERIAPGTDEARRALELLSTIGSR